MGLAATVSIVTEGGSRHAPLSEFLDAEREETAACEANAWIKALRHAQVDGVPFRQRFTYRGDSLWWFAELYLHKERAILTAFRAAHAAEALMQRERPRAIRLIDGGDAARVVLPQVCAAHRVRYEGPRLRGVLRRLSVMDARSAVLAGAAMASPRPARIVHRDPVTVAAFVHRAFWRADGGDGSAESYIGPVLHALETKLPREAIAYVGVGPGTNFRARRWWRPAASADRIERVEALAPRRALAGSWRVWRTRHAVRRALMGSEALRGAAIIRGCDCWPIVREALAGIALLQFPWSARAMDEAGAALDALRPSVAVTYAEAGGWGRALALEARRRHVPLAGLQHGFIYRHWLNYRHEPDEMAPLDTSPRDSGFPRPSLTLVFDEYAADHLVHAGRFPSASIAVTGSPRLDAVAAEMSALSPERILEARRAAGAAAEEPLVLIVSKYVEIREQLPGVLEAVRRLPGVRAAIKTHPAETAEPYQSAAAGIANVRVLPPAAPLAPLLRGAQAIVTVNSTVAIDALALGVPALSVGLPNNLSPFVAAGAVMGTTARDEIPTALERLLYDRGFRQQLSDAAASVAGRYRIAPDGRAAERSAAAILQLAGERADR